ARLADTARLYQAMGTPPTERVDTVATDRPARDAAAASRPPSSPVSP
ncbi:TPA: hypothetical protein QDB64_002090, partial [Burkholderia multivorans]|nr:hypothetical protein [Burkholderia multivorans]